MNNQSSPTKRITGREIKLGGSLGVGKIQLPDPLSVLFTVLYICMNTMEKKIEKPVHIAKITL